MAIDKEQVNFVHYCIHDDLLLSFIRPVRHNRQRSLDSYERLCRQALERQYPNAQISLSHNTGDGLQSASSETRLYAYLDLAESEYENEIQDVNLICERIAQRFGWLVPVVSTRVSKSTQYCCDLPVVLVRWACVKDLVEGADKEDGLWEVPLDALLSFADSIWTATATAVSSAPEWKMLVWDSLGGATLDTVPESTESVIVAHDGFGLPFLGPTCSYFRLSREQTNVRLTLEHFIDVEGWANPHWSYEAYCKHLKEQAAR